MDDTREILEKVSKGEISVDDAVLKLKIQPFEDLGFAKVDHHRKLRQGNAEVIYGRGKAPEQIIDISESMLRNKDGAVIITGMSEQAAKQFQKSKVSSYGFKYNEIGKIGVAGTAKKPDGTGRILVCTAGTSDIPVAEEAAVTAEAMGNEVTRIYDVGVSGMHRLLAHAEEIMSAQVIVAIAGMEGALASVIGGLADCPVIGVPTSVGYGTAFGGVTALLSMLNSCASGVSVVNIDNGFGAGYLASMINHRK